MKRIVSHSPQFPNKDNLIYVYDVFNKIFQGKDVFYTTEEVKKLKKDKSNNFI